MAYKKYIKRDGKVFGPYYYESYRDKNGKVRKKYVGVTDPKIPRVNHFSISRIKVNKLFIGGVILGILILAVFLFYNFSFTGRSILDIQDYSYDGENVVGDLKLSLKSGELLPLDSVIVISYNGIVNEIPLSNLLENTANGTFFVDNSGISGEGEGYGVLGSKTIYPEVYFKMNVYDGETSVGSVSETPAESSFPLTTDYVATIINVPAGNSTYYRFWMDVPAAAAGGAYNNSVSFEGVQTGTAC